ncbi:MAG: pyridoxamine 5'-phosphate oxidase family protein [Desulfatibacillaceae bacterium]
MEDFAGYFETTEGFGVLSTADSEGRPNAAVFSRPHVMEDGIVAFIMPERKTYANLVENSGAHYLFREKGGGYKGKRLWLTKIREEKDTDLLYELRRREYPERNEENNPRHLVFFTVDKLLPLVGAGEE